MLSNNIIQIHRRSHYLKSSWRCHLPE